MPLQTFKIQELVDPPSLSVVAEIEQADEVEITVTIRAIRRDEYHRFPVGQAHSSRFHLVRTAVESGKHALLFGVARELLNAVFRRYFGMDAGDGAHP